VPPADHARFYASSRFTLNVTRADMIRAGYSPSVRLFEAAAAATPIVSDEWPGLETIFVPGREIVVAERPAAVLEVLTGWSETERRRLGSAARERVLADHTAAHRAGELEAHIARVRSRPKNNRIFREVQCATAE
jgi:spore maturation protein CgeB